MWIKFKRASYQITGTNIKETDTEYQLWATRHDGRGVTLLKSKFEKDILELKQAIDFAVEHGETSFELE